MLHFCIHFINKLIQTFGVGMTAHSSILLWEISWTEEPGRLQSMELQRGGHDEGMSRNISIKPCV